ncbi:MAG: OB-fold nucleic acid binding domain-containing protein, partial [Oligoflexia bacterium]|nr:OB-fold nucleic acid binding domain-containing protein [Oligoflexia bacterium]
MGTSPITPPKRTVRSHTCGELRASDLGKEVELCGWIAKRRDHGGLVFTDLRDRYGLTQLVFDPALTGGAEAHAAAGRLRQEFVVWCKGKVRRRPEGMTNPKLPTGEIEVACTELEILSEAKTPPFEVSMDLDGETGVAETTR